jgi:hypothetical protein
MVLKYAELPEDITSTNSGEALVHRRLIYPRSRTSIASADVRLGCAPWKGGAFQWVQGPPGNRSSRKQPEQSWR